MSFRPPRSPGGSWAPVTVLVQESGCGGRGAAHGDSRRADPGWWAHNDSQNWTPDTYGVSPPSATPTRFVRKQRQLWSARREPPSAQKPRSLEIQSETWSHHEDCSWRNTMGTPWWQQLCPHEQHPSRFSGWSVGAPRGNAPLGEAATPLWTVALSPRSALPQLTRHRCPISPVSGGFVPRSPRTHGPLPLPLAWPLLVWILSLTWTNVVKLIPLQIQIKKPPRSTPCLVFFIRDSG